MSGGFWKRVMGGGGEEVSGDAKRAVPAGLQRYEIGEELGRGAMAIVYRAADKQTGEVVAIKRLALQREFASEDLAEVRQRFMREARAAGHLQHPDILRVIDAGEAEQDAWIAMELVQGQDLSHFTRSGQLLPLRETLELGIRLARALAYAHSQGVVHRDIKPANVMLERTSAAVKIMDFGIARIADGSRTRTGLVLGTPSFMSPEQLAGLKVDGRSDLYSLGALLYQLLTGQLPHQSESMAKLMYRIANEPAPDIRHYRKELPESLALVLALALEKRPELRYASGEQLAQDLEAILPQLPAEAEGVLPIAPLAGLSQPQSVDPFAQTQRLDAAEAGQNPRTLP
ncbi:serine/threonine-protein kinase [Pelomonas sp. SE-A7]|uniref:serine/threonine-protein kinase n=1 Tax=Pelomonas sp. SE-A7 TaxID=3054953 RepID=UPI00259C75FF|nr:serine/threonine-protein kinase [Pelomonas sp. SE-A7]MDM4767059.1 serine/threonine-protein kinase [Pelomonas sp. SE-A7]